MSKTTTIDSQYFSEFFLRNIDHELASAWRTVAEFSLTINLAVGSKHQIAIGTFLDTMAAVMYRLLSMTSFEAGSTEEAIRLGLLAFSSSIFLPWKKIGISYDHLASTYKGCLARMSCSNTPSRLLLWLLMVGAVSVFGDADGEWLKPWLRVIIHLAKVESWVDMQEKLRSLMWIGLVHDVPGKDMFDSVIISGSPIPLLDPSPASNGSL